MSSNVSIECVKASGSAIVEEDLCTIVSTTLLGSTSLGSAIFPAFMTGNKSALSLKYLEGFSVDEQISTTTDEDGNETVRVSYVLNYHQRVPTSVKCVLLPRDVSDIFTHTHIRTHTYTHMDNLSLSTARQA